MVFFHSKEWDVKNIGWSNKDEIEGSKLTTRMGVKGSKLTTRMGVKGSERD